VNFALDLAAERLVTVLDDWAPPPIDRFFLYYPSIHQHDVPSVEPKFAKGSNAKGSNNGLIVTGSPSATLHRNLIITLAERG
jgi:hypothetical protein